MDIKKIAKEYTRKEFIDRRGNICPNTLGLKHFCGERCKSYNCRSCWLEAIKNIKFIGEEEVEEYTIREVIARIKEGEHYEAVDKSILKIQEIYHDGINICFRHVEEDLELPIKVDEKFVLKKEGKKMDKYDKEYSIQEAMAMENGTNFDMKYLDGTSPNTSCRVSTDETASKILIWNDDNKEVPLLGEIINAKFKLKNRERKVGNAKIALQAYRACKKTIKCRWENNTYTYEWNEDGLENNENGLPVSATELIDGEWYVVD